MAAIGGSADMASSGAGSTGGGGLGSSGAVGMDLSSGEDPAPPVEFSFADDPNPKHRPQNEDAHVITSLLESEEYSVAPLSTTGGSAEYAPRSFDGLHTGKGAAGEGGASDAAVRQSGSFTGLESYKDAASARLAKDGTLARTSSDAPTSGKKKTLPLAARLVRPIHMFAVLDGHGGKACAAFCAEKLVETLQQKLCKHKRWASALPEAFQETDKLFHRALSKDTSGSTCAAAIIHGHGEKRELVLAHVGDSRIVVWDTESGAGHARRLTTDHTPAVRAEVDRLESEGGFVARGRVMGVLAVTRAFGNWEMKKQSPSHPDVSRIRLGLPPPKRSDRFLIIACDGLWDVLSDTDACKIVRGHLKKGGKPEGAAKVLVQEAIARRTTDNVTVMVVYC